jgi:crossover junction endodeoxyribonuclease RuvC
VLGIDPGLVVTGYGCVACEGVDVRLVEAGVFKLVHGARHKPSERNPDRAPSRARSVSDRLVELDRDLKALIERLRPDLVAVEALFAHYKHPATAIVMGHARGVILLGARRAGIEILELRPAEVKKFVTGHGQAKKQQMQGAVATALGLAAPPEPPDVADALGIAMCAAARVSLGVRRARPSRT